MARARPTTGSTESVHSRRLFATRFIGVRFTAGASMLSDGDAISIPRAVHWTMRFVSVRRGVWPTRLAVRLTSDEALLIST